MATFKRPDAELYYEVYGSGFPLLLFAAGGLRSQAAYWKHSPSDPKAAPPWMNPMADLSSRFTVIGMDQRNAGQSHAAVTSTHGWHTPLRARCRSLVAASPRNRRRRQSRRSN